MKTGSYLDEFSAFIFELHACSASDPVALFQWSVEKLGKIVQADCCWAGWADLNPQQVDVHATVSFNLPRDYTHFWSKMRHEDLLARDAIMGRRTAFYDRYGARQTEGMAALADRYHINKMATVTTGRKDTGALMYMSAYRSGPRAQPIETKAADLLRNALEHVRYLIEHRSGSAPDAVSILANSEGRVLVAPSAALHFIQQHWQRWNGTHLPAEIQTACASGDKRLLQERGISFGKHDLTDQTGQRLFGITLRGSSPYDHLTARERQIAGEIANGRTYKEIAKLLGLSPATVRNHAQAILTKTGVHSKTSLAKFVCAAK